MHTLLLILSISTLLLGPILSKISSSKPFTKRVFDGFMVVMLFGLVGLHVLPESIHEGGAYAAFAFLFGFLAPVIIHNISHSMESKLKVPMLFMIVVGLVAHSIGDGAFVAMASHLAETKESYFYLLFALAILFHRLPEGAGIWHYSYKNYGKKIAVLSLSVLVVATVIGYTTALSLASYAVELPLSMLQALMAGFILQILFHNHQHDYMEHDHSKKCTQAKVKLHTSHALGATIAIILLSSLQIIESKVPIHFHHHNSSHDHHSHHDHGHSHHHKH